MLRWKYFKNPHMLKRTDKATIYSFSSQYCYGFTTLYNLSFYGVISSSSSSFIILILHITCMTSVLYTVSPLWCYILFLIFFCPSDSLHYSYKFTALYNLSFYGVRSSGWSSFVIQIPRSTLMPSYSIQKNKQIEMNDWRGWNYNWRLHHIIKASFTTILVKQIRHKKKMAAPESAWRGDAWLMMLIIVGVIKVLI